MQTFNVNVSMETVARFCEKWDVRELCLFGSSVRGELRSDSDVDILVSFAPQANHSLFDLVTMQEELQDIFCRPVDLVEKEAVEKSENYIRRKSILNSRKILYAA